FRRLIGQLKEPMMPNWTMNELEIEHEDPMMIERLAAAFEGTRLLGEFLPEPEDYRSWSPPEEGRLAERWRRCRPEEYWYEWRCEYWGTKWETGLRPDDGSRIERVSANKLRVVFFTAWCYPEPVFQEMLRQGYSIKGRMEDDMGNFEVIYDNGGIEEC